MDKMTGYEIDLKFFNKLLSVAYDAGAHVEIYEGSLLDSAIISDAQAIKIKGLRRVKHIVIREQYANTWTSRLMMYLTDCDKRMMAHESELTA